MSDTKQMSLFGGGPKEKKASAHWKLFFDGASRNNPGPAGVGSAGLGRATGGRGSGGTRAGVGGVAGRQRRARRVRSHSAADALEHDGAA